MHIKSSGTHHHNAISVFTKVSTARTKCPAKTKIVILWVDTACILPVVHSGTVVVIIMGPFVVALEYLLIVFNHLAAKDRLSKQQTKYAHLELILLL